MEGATERATQDIFQHGPDPILELYFSDTEFQILRSLLFHAVSLQGIF